MARVTWSQCAGRDCLRIAGVDAELDVVVETQNRRHVATIIDALVAAGFPTRLLSASEDSPEAIPAGSAS